MFDNSKGFPYVYPNTWDIIAIPTVVRYIGDSTSVSVLNVYECLTSFNWQEIQNLFLNARDYIINLICYPFDLASFENKTLTESDYQQVTLGKVSENHTSGIYGVSLNTLGVDTIQELTIGSWAISEILPHNHTGVPEYLIDSVDFAPTTKYKLWLPFYGYIDLDINFFYHSNITVKYLLDYHTGKATIQVGTSTLKGGELNNIYFSETTQVGQEVPLSYDNSRDIARNNLTTTVSFGGSLLSSIFGGQFGVAAGIGGATRTINSIVSNNVKHMTTGKINGELNLMRNNMRPFIMVTYRNTSVSDIDTYKSLNGLPLEECKSLSELTGYTEVGDIHLENIIATQEELDRIDTLLKEGVIL